MNLTLTPAKLQQISQLCGSTVAAAHIGILVKDLRLTVPALAAILSTSAAHLTNVLALPEPTVYPPMTTTNV